MRDEIHSAISKRAADLAWTHWPGKSVEDLEKEVWRTPEGKELYELHRSYGHLPMSQVEQSIGKPLAHIDAWNVLQSWRAG